MKTIRIFALLLALLMVFSAASAEKTPFEEENIPDAARFAMYQNAILAAENGLYLTAVENLTSLGDFYDSELLTAYYTARAYEELEKYEDAEKLLTPISLFKDSASRMSTYPEKINARDYRIADEQEAAGKLEAALLGFAALGDYQDSAARAVTVQGKIDERDYQAAVDAETKGEVIAAYDGFKALGSYKDSADRAALLEQKASYARGIEYMNSGKYTDALAIFRKLGNYEDCSELVYCLGISEFAKLEKVVDGVAKFEFHDVYGLVNFNERTTAAPKWIKIERFNDGLAAVSSSTGYGAIDLTGKEVVSCVWDDISDYNDGVFVVSRENARYDYRLGLVSGSGVQLGDVTWKTLGRSDTIYGSPYAYAASFSSGLISVSDENWNYGFIDKQGQVVIQPQYKAVNEFSDGLAAVKQGDLWGYIDPTGAVVIPFQYSDCTSFKDGTVHARYGDWWMIIDKQGNQLYFR